MTEQNYLKYDMSSVILNQCCGPTHSSGDHLFRECVVETSLRASSVDGGDIALDFMAQLSLKVTQLLLKDSQCRYDNGLRTQRAT